MTLPLVLRPNELVTDLSVSGVIGGLTFITDLTLPCGLVIHDHLAT